MKLRSGVPTWLLLALVAAPVAAQQPEPPRPHVVLILADDLGWGDVGYLGSEIRTPNLDRLAADGLRLDRMYTLHACTPTRAALLTGRYPIRYGLQSGVLWPWSYGGLPLEERTLAEALREAGYRTVMIGKWHLGLNPPDHLPLEQGFEHHYGLYTGLIDYFEHRYYAALDWHRNGEPVVEEGYATTLLADEAVRIIEGHDPATPLFAYVPFNAPHAPLQVPEEYLAPYQGIENEHRRTYAGMVTALDEAVGRIVEALEDRGLAERTLFLFLSDNGADPAVGGRNGRLRGQKGTLYEGGLRVPAFARWTGVLGSGSVLEETIHVVDLMPTLVGLAGGSLEQPLPLDGVDVWPTLRDGTPPDRSELLLNIGDGQSAIRVGQWKLVKTFELIESKFELFDVVRDPYERINLARSQSERLRDLQSRLRRYRKEAVTPLGPFPPKKPVNYPMPKAWGERGRSDVDR